MKDTPLIAEIRRLHEGRQTGMLTLANASGEKVDIFFREGAIEAASSNLNSRKLGDYLVKLGHLAAHDLDAVLSEARRKRIFFGEAAVRKKLTEQSHVGVAVQNQVLELVSRVLRDDFTVDSFTTCLKSYYAPARLTFSSLLLELARTNSTPAQLLAGERIGTTTLQDWTEYPWCPEELSVLNALSSPRTIEEIQEMTGLNDASLARVLGVLRSLDATQTEVSVPSNGAIAEVLPFERLIPVVPNRLDEKLDAARNGSAFTSEQFKNLKVLITEASSLNTLKVLTISSPDTRDGKSLISANLAFSFAMDPGRRVLIIDCDLRNPALARYLGVPSDPGLLQYMWNNGRLEPHCYLRRTENLYFMTAGGTALNPIEILSMQKMKRLIEILRQDFDTIILDAPPYHPIADARVVTGMSDGLLMVVRRGKTAYSSSDRAFKAVDRNKLLGVVFNDVKPMPFDNGFNYEYYSNTRGPRLSGAGHNGKYLES